MRFEKPCAEMHAFFWFRVFYYDIGFDIVLAHRCWWKYIFYVHKNGRRDTVRRNVLGDVQSEDMFINGMGFWA